MPELMRSRYVVDEFNEELIQKYAEYLCDPSNVSIMMRSKSFEGKTDLTAEWYNTKYSVQDFPEDIK